ncbi:hypothetical protein SAY87_001346 [Trapa incisa]|uniref:DNA-directed RNA polymerase n=1 Tax=Trapa incisa TaxID=236973 RepID=A0AAN7GD35_9MYRT|nr:hypothetical protein SAY87_001346 [Trapa incisa]
MVAKAEDDRMLYFTSLRGVRKTYKDCCSDFCINTSMIDKQKAERLKGLILKAEEPKVGAFYRLRKKKPPGEGIGSCQRREAKMEVDDVIETAASGNPLGQCLCSFVNQGSTESHRYYLARRTLLEMLRDRGYVIPESELNQSFEEFLTDRGSNPDIERLRISSAHRYNPSKRILAIFCGPAVVKVSVIRSIGSQIANKESLTSLILVLQSSISNQAMKAVDIWPFKVEIFQITSLLVNITKHVLKPKLVVLTESEKQNLLKKYSIQEKQLPRMMLKDALARYYGFEKGQVVKVTHSGEISSTHVTYRSEKMIFKSKTLLISFKTSEPSSHGLYLLLEKPLPVFHMVELLYTKFMSLVKADPIIHALSPPSPRGEICDINGVCINSVEDEFFRLTTRERKLTVRARPSSDP